MNLKGLHLKRLLTGILAGMTALSAAACSTGTNETGGSATPTPAASQSSANPAPTPEKPTELSIVLRLPATFILENNPVIEEWEKRTNTVLDIESPPINNYNDRLNIIMASGDLPDLLYLGNTGALYQGWARDGLLLKLDEYLDKEMPNAKAVLNDNELYFVRISELGDSLYSLPRVQTKAMDCLLYRKDWLDGLGLSVPKTPTEFADVMLAFAKNDPDKNSKDDTYGWSYNSVMGDMFRSLVSGFGLRPTSVPDTNGNYAIMQAQDNYMVYMDWLRDMYVSGAMDPEWYLIQMYEDEDLWNAGKIGTLYSNVTASHLITKGYSPDFVASNPNAEVIAGPPLMQEGETIAGVYYYPAVWGNFGISADSRNIEKAVEFLDYGYTDECNELLYFGLEGITYTSYDAERKYAAKTPEQVKASEQFTSSYLTFNYQRQDKSILSAFGSTEEELALYLEADASIRKESRQVYYLPEGSLPGMNDQLVKISDSGLDTKYKELRTKYICNQISREEFVSFLQNDYIPAHNGILDILNSSGLNK